MFSDFTAISKKVSLKADLSNIDLENSIFTIISKIIVFPCLNLDNLILVFHKEKFSREKRSLDLTDQEKISLLKTSSSVKTLTSLVKLSDYMTVINTPENSIKILASTNYQLNRNLLITSKLK